MDELIHEWRGATPPPGWAPTAPPDALWQAQDAGAWRAYAVHTPTSSAGWQRLQLLRRIDGASAGSAAACHYVVETDVAAPNADEFNAWYETEHLPGLARVPGTVRAQRWLRLDGAPRYVACYDLLSPQALEHPDWLAVRHTPWSARVRPMFLNPQRSLYRRAAPTP